MSKYTFTFKKDDVFVEFITEDREVVERQFQIWVADADEYARNNGQMPPKPKVAVQQEVKQEPKAAPKVEPKQEQKPVERAPERREPEVVKEEPVVQPTPAEPVFDQASTLLRTINTIQNEQPEAQIINGQDQSAIIDFGSVLDEKIENPTFEPTKNSDPIFLNLVNSKQTTDRFHYLIITAYYLAEFEKLDRFSLKQINAKLMQNISEIIDHSTLQEAINQGFIEALPDLTGVAEVAEYRLTRAGEEFFAHRI
jgi:hypothetical protein